MTDDRIRVILTTGTANSREIHADPDALYVSTRQPYVARCGHRLRLDRPARSVLIALAANAGRWFTPEELIELCFGDDPIGGPESARQRVRQAVVDVRMAGAALNLIVSTKYMSACMRATNWSAEGAAA